MQIVIILRQILNAALSEVRAVSIAIWQLKCQQRQINKPKNGKLFLWKLFRIIKFFFLSLLREVTLELKVAPTKRNSSAFLLHTSKAFFNVGLFSIFSQTFLELVFATKIKTMLLKQSAVLFSSCHKNIAYTRIMCLNI